MTTMSNLDPGCIELELEKAFVKKCEQNYVSGRVPALVWLDSLLCPQSISPLSSQAVTRILATPSPPMPTRGSRQYTAGGSLYSVASNIFNKNVVWIFCHNQSEINFCRFYRNLHFQRASTYSVG